MTGRRFRLRLPSPFALGAFAVGVLGIALSLLLLGRRTAPPVVIRPLPTRPPGPTPTASPTPAYRHVGAGTVSMLHVPAADASGGYRSVWVYRPGVPDSAQLPVLYFLHGLPGDATDITKSNITATLDREFTRGHVPPFVVAAPDGNSTGAADPEWANSSDGTVQVESFVTGPLIAAVEGTARRDRDHRAIAGFSMGGYGAMNLALRHPGLYGQVVSIAGYFKLDDESSIFATSHARKANSPDHNVERASMLRIMLVEGVNDVEPVVTGEAQRFATLLRQAGQHPVLERPPGGHDWATLTAEWPRVIQFLESGWAA